MAREETKLQPPTDIISKYISDSVHLVDVADRKVRQYQRGELKPIKFSKEFLNKNLLGGLRPGDIVGLAGSSGHGKSFLLQEMERDIFDDTLNPDNKDYILLRNNYEMSVFKLYLRELKKATNKSITELLSSEFSESDRAIADSIFKKESDPRIKYFENPQTPDVWFEVMKAFCERHKECKHIVITIDHIALVKQTAGGKKDGIDNLVEYINQLRHLYDNISFLILSQLNRNIEERDNPKTSAPRKGDLYQSDFLFQISDVIIVVHNPYKLGLQEHMVVGQSQYPYLNSFKKDPGKKATTFLTKGNIFYHFIKLREDEGGTLDDVFIERITKSQFRADYLDYQEELPRIEPSADLFGDDELTPYD